MGGVSRSDEVFPYNFVPFVGVFDFFHPIDDLFKQNNGIHQNQNNFIEFNRRSLFRRAYRGGVVKIILILFAHSALNYYLTATLSR